MSSTIDYYHILGVTPSADLAVIKAVYKALALKFHPDRNKESPDVAAKRMSEINEAYSVLSDEQKRAAYDKSRRGSSEQDQFDDEDQDFSRQFSDVEKQIEADWALAKKYYPDLDVLVSTLAKVSSSLILPFKLTLLEKQDFSNRNKIAEAMLNAYMTSYFGKNPEIIKFAESLLRQGRRDAARELNKVVTLFGKDINAATVISTIKSEYKLNEKQDTQYAREDEGLDTEIKRLNAEREALFKELAKARAASPGYLSNAWKAVIFLMIPLFALATYGEIYTWEDYPILADIFVGYLLFFVLIGSIVSGTESWYQGDIRKLEREIKKIDKEIQKLRKSKTA
jgi:curved DNA-binding protein CbpA